MLVADQEWLLYCKSTKSYTTLLHSICAYSTCISECEDTVNKLYPYLINTQYIHSYDNL